MEHIDSWRKKNDDGCVNYLSYSKEEVLDIGEHYLCRNIMGLFLTNCAMIFDQFDYTSDSAHREC